MRERKKDKRGERKDRGGETERLFRESKYTGDKI